MSQRNTQAVQLEKVYARSEELEVGLGETEHEVDRLERSALNLQSNIQMLDELVDVFAPPLSIEIQDSVDKITDAFGKKVQLDKPKEGALRRVIGDVLRLTPEAPPVAGIRATGKREPQWYEANSNPPVGTEPCEYTFDRECSKCCHWFQIRLIRNLNHPAEFVAGTQTCPRHTNRKQIDNK